MTSRRVSSAIFAAVLLCLTAACSSDPEPTPTQQIDGVKYGTGEERVDVAPLTKRYAGLGTPTKAVWYSGTLGPSGDRAPGPSDYWIDAVVTVDAATAKTLAATSTAQGTAPDVVPQLRDEVRELRLQQIADLAESSQQALPNRAWIDTERRVVVLVARGE